MHLWLDIFEFVQFGADDNVTTPTHGAAQLRHMALHSHVLVQIGTKVPHRIIRLKYDILK